MIVGNCLLVLDAIHPLDHLVVQTARAAPANRRRQHHRIRPMDESLIDLTHLVVSVHLGDRAGPSAGARGLAVEPLALAEGKIAQADSSRLAVAVRHSLTQAMIKQLVRRAVAGLASRHRGGRNAEDADRPGLAPHRSRQRMRAMRFSSALRSCDVSD